MNIFILLCVANEMRVTFFGLRTKIVFILLKVKKKSNGI